MPDHVDCPGPNCTGHLTDRSPLPDFCCYACAEAWARADHPTIPAIDHGAGHIDGVAFGPGPDRNRGDRPRAIAFDWLDARPEVAP